MRIPTLHRDDRRPPSILLLGEFSGVHLALSKGFRRLGIRCSVASHGDGWKQVQTDCLLRSADGPCKYHAYAFWNFFKLIRQIRSCNYLGIVNPRFFDAPFIHNRLILTFARRQCCRMWVLACGDDAVLLRYGLPGLKYHFYDDWRRTDNNCKPGMWESEKSLTFNLFVANIVDKIFATGYEYSLGYKALAVPNLERLLLPIDCEEYEIFSSQEPRSFERKIRLFHGISRPGFKGSAIIVPALNRILQNFPSRVELRIVERLSHRDYLRELSESDIVVDQVRSYSYGINALIGMACGKVVISGAEPEAVAWAGVAGCPVVNVRPCQEMLMETIQDLIANPDRMRTISREGVRFVDVYHRCESVARTLADSIGMNYDSFDRNVTV